MLADRRGKIVKKNDKVVDTKRPSVTFCGLFLVIESIGSANNCMVESEVFCCLI